MMAAQKTGWWGLVVVLWVWVGSGFVVEAAAPHVCFSLRKTQQYERAARCYLRLFGQVDKHAIWRKDAALYKDRFLRQAAGSYVQMSRRATSVGQKNYMKLQAVKYLRLSFQQGFCEAADRCRSNGLLADKINNSIQYTLLTVVTSQNKAKIVVEGYRWRASRVQRFVRKLPPGRYRVRIVLPGRKEQTRLVMLRPGRPVMINATPTKIVVREKRILVAKKIPPLVISGYVIGATMVLAGAVMLIYGVVEQGRLNGINSDSNANQSLTVSEYDSGFERAEAVKIAGGVTGGAGISLVVGGVIAHVSANAAARRKQSVPASTKPIHLTRNLVFVQIR